MEKTVTVPEDEHFKKTNITVKVPEICPICNKNMLPRCFPNVSVSDVEIDSTGNIPVYEAALIARCTSCNHLYTIFFKLFSNNEFDPIPFGDLYFQTKIPKIDVPISKNIKNISPSFVKIYTQALQAEKLQLNELVGMGLRKALEFLIKDYAIFNYPKKELEIKKLPLSQVIEKYVDFNDLKILAKGAAWIGNDETHYVKKWPHKDLNDLKKYIEASMSFIELKSNIFDAQKMIEEKSNK